MSPGHLVRLTGMTEDRTFHRLLLNTLVTGVTGSFVWFALTFWVFLETRSVVATGMIGAAFSLSSAVLGPVFGTYIDRHRKHSSMLLSTSIAVGCYAAATAVFLAVDAGEILEMTGPWFWLLVAFTLLGSVAGSMRGIALSTCVTLLVPEDRRDKANGLVGSVTGVSFAITSVFSGLVIGQLGMGWALYGSLALTAGALLHLATLRIPEDVPTPSEGEPTSAFDVRTAIDAIRAVPGLPMLVGLAAFNNLLLGAFMALMDPYGLSLVSVETWGFLWGGIMLAFVAGGLLVAKRGLGSAPVKVVVTGNLISWAIASTFVLRSSIVLLAVGLFVWLLLMPVIEAAEQTVLQQSIPFEKQGRVFGFAQMIENATAPVTAICMAPLAEAVFMPLMTDGAGADWIGSWFGTGPDRGIALIFTLAGLVGVLVSLLVRASRSYRLLVEDAAAPVEPVALPCPEPCPDAPVLVPVAA
jgi:DHA3 family multidrug efflux protein-like MFS transporter